MRKTIYKAITTRLNGANLDIKHISLWNRNTEQLATQKGFRLPAVFVEFEPIQWSQLQSRARSADLRIRLHIVTETLATPEDGSSYQDQALEHLDLIESISGVMQGLCGDGFNGLMLVESVTDHDHERIEQNEECYITRVTDTSAVKPRAVAVGVRLMQGK